MLISLTTLFVTLSSIFRSRAALQLENLALRHAAAFRQKTSRVDSRRPLPLGLAVSRVERLALDASHGSTRDRHCLASCRLSPVLDLEGSARPTRTTGHLPRGSRSDPPDVSGESRLGSALLA